MASRRPPSQRDPEYALHRLAGLFSQVLPGAKVRNAAPVKTAIPSRAIAPSGDSEHNGTGADSTAVGTASVASGASSTALGDDSYAPGDGTVAVGFNTAARPVGSVAVGYNAGVTALADYGIAVGYQAGASAVGAIALGHNASASGVGGMTFGTGNNNMAHTAMMFADDLRLRPQSGGATRYILSSPSAYEYAITVSDAGVLFVVAA